MSALLGIAIFLGLVMLYLFVIIFFPILKVELQPVVKVKNRKTAPGNREDVSFTVQGERISGWFYKTPSVAKAPCIVMCHGFGGTKDAGLEPYAIRFADAGYSVLTFDYRFYGESGGTPRQLYCGPYQLDDVRGAIEYIRTREDVDNERIVVWGTSAGAPYVIVIAARDPAIAAVIGQCGSFDHKEDSRIYIEREGWGFFMKLFVHGQRDKGRSRFGLSPHKFPAYGNPGSVAMITAPGAFEGIGKLVAESETFVNETCARLALLPHIPDPLKLAERVKCPVHIAVCTKDGIVSPKSHLRLVEALKAPVDVKAYPVEHFDLYTGETFMESTDDQIAFLNSHLKERTTG